jgi:hypothetical protein
MKPELIKQGNFKHLEDEVPNKRKLKHIWPLVLAVSPVSTVVSDF